MASFVFLVLASSIANVFVMTLCSVSVITLTVYLLYILKTGRIANMTAFKVILLIYKNVILISSFFPLLKIGAGQGEDDVQSVVTNIYVFYGIALGLILLGVLLTTFLLKDSIKKSNWWVFVASLPYIFTSWIMYRDYTGFNQFVHADNF